MSNVTKRNSLAAVMLAAATGLLGAGESQAAESKQQCEQDLNDPTLLWDIYRPQLSDTYNYVGFRLVEQENPETGETELIKEATGCLYLSRDEYYTQPQGADVRAARNYDLTQPRDFERFNDMVNNIIHLQNEKYWDAHCGEGVPAYDGQTQQRCDFLLGYSR